MKESWPVWLLIGAGLVVIVLALLQRQSAQESVSFTEIFPVQDVAVQPPSVEAARPAPEVVKADPVSVPSIVTSSSNDGKEEGYTIQMYSFQDEKKAEAALAKLKSEGHAAYILVSDLGDRGIWHRVRVGNFANEGVAQELLVRLREKYQSGIIVRTDPQ